MRPSSQSSRDRAPANLTAKASVDTGPFTFAPRDAATVSPVVELLAPDLDFETAAGVRALLGATMRRLCELPLDARVANAITAAAGAQRAVVETAVLEARVAALEALEAKTNTPQRGE